MRPEEMPNEAVMKLEKGYSFIPELRQWLFGASRGSLVELDTHTHSQTAADWLPTEPVMRTVPPADRLSALDAEWTVRGGRGSAAACWAPG
ncbi:hypothetical protein MHYP_G00129420 [Metynnis hypsauchen]